MTTYTPFSWTNGDDIYDTSLNRMETGITDAFKWSEMTIDDDKDMSGNDLTNLGEVESAHFTGDFIRLVGDSAAGSAYTVAGPITVTFAEGEKTIGTKGAPANVIAGSSLYIALEAKVANPGEQMVIVVYQNAVPVGSVIVVTETTYTAKYKEIASLDASDVILVTAQVTSGVYTGYVQNLEYRAAEIPATDPAAW